MRAPLGARDRVHLVQDHRLDARQRVARGRRQHQEQGLRGGDQDVRRAGGQGAALGGRSVAGADTDLDLGLGQAQADGFLADAGERGAEVALDVDSEGFQRRHVQNAAALSRVGGRGCRGELVQGCEEGGQGLAGTGRGDHQHVRALADGLPRARLGRGGRGEGPREPAAGRGGEAVEGSVCGTDHASILHPTTDNPSDLRKFCDGCSPDRFGSLSAVAGRIVSAASGRRGRDRALASPSPWRRMAVWRVRASWRGTGGTRSCPASTCCGPGTSTRRSSGTRTRTSSSPPSRTA